MFRSLRVPERLFQIATWVVSIVFASFLIGLGGKIVGELPGVDQYVTIQQYMDPARTTRLRTTRDSLIARDRDVSAAQERARLSLTAASNAYRASRESFQNWIDTRVATTDPQQDPEVLRRTTELDRLKGGERAAQTEVEAPCSGVLKPSRTSPFSLIQPIAICSSRLMCRCSGVMIPPGITAKARMPRLL